MGERTPLGQNTELRFRNHEGGEVCYVIRNVAGYGGTCMVYDGYYRNTTGARKAVRIKECYPYCLTVTREKSGELRVPEREEHRLEAFRLQARESFAISNELYRTAGLSNSISNLLDLYEGNNTVYIVSSYMEGNTLAEYEPETLLDAVKLVSSVAGSIGRIHRKGYLYLDVKPENIFVLPETVELVQLFDFDSMLPMIRREGLKEYRISYSEGFAPVEQKKGDGSRLGAFSDVYSVGALLFFLLFGRAPRAYDCGGQAEYDFGSINWPGCYQDSLFFEITDFFRHTLQSYPDDRYQEMEEAARQLAVIQRYADRSIPYLCSSVIPGQETVIGRDRELGALSEWWAGGEQVIFVSGMGGIGKSTLVRQFWRAHRERMDHAVYLYFHGSLCETVGDDDQLVLNLYEKNPAETGREYFKRKIKGIRKLAAGTATLLVIDNFEGSLDEDFPVLLRAGWRVIVVTRADMEGTGYRQLRVGELSSQEELRELFFAKLGRRLEGAEIGQLDRMVEGVAGHTLALELIAKQIAGSYLTMGQALALTEQKGFSEMAPERVGFHKDGRSYCARVPAILQSVCGLERMAEEKQRVLKAVSLFDMPGIALAELKALLELESFDEINELREEGWLYVQGGNAWLHPLIREINHQGAWKAGDRRIAIREMELLSQRLRLTGQETKGRMGRLSQARSVLNCCSKDRKLSGCHSYKKLLLAVVLHTPRDQEKYIMAQAAFLLRHTDGQNPKDIMKLYDYMVYLYCQRQEFASARSSLASAFRFVKAQSDPFVHGVYYEMLGGYYDSVLDGAYCLPGRREKRLFEKMLAANRKAIYFMEQAKGEEAGPCLIKDMLGEAMLLIRCRPEGAEEPRRLIHMAGRLIRRQGQKETQAGTAYDMARAWYYTLCEPNQALVRRYLKKAGEAYRAFGTPGLDYIDDYIVPAANMMCELGEEPEASRLLEEGAARCDSFPDMIPYIRKKRELMGYQRELWK